MIREHLQSPEWALSVPFTNKSNNDLLTTNRSPNLPVKHTSLANDLKPQYARARPLGNMLGGAKRNSPPKISRLEVCFIVSHEMLRGRDNAQYPISFDGVTNQFLFSSILVGTLSATTDKGLPMRMTGLSAQTATLT
jgi:hypothetical protein